MPTRYQPAPPLVATMDADMLQRGLGRLRLIDARAPERFRGEVEPLDPVAGHIPGALNRPFKDNLAADGRFLPPAQLRAAFEPLLGGRPADETVHQCGSGVTACHNLLAMEVAGLPGTLLYPGSWSEWCADPKRPVARG
jgi:thiosulfate/3-mercaptopyruvate sulfurtransferase